MERDRPNIDRVREVLQDEDDRVREEPDPLETADEDSADGDDVDESDR
jgi:hypothetical protein